MEIRFGGLEGDEKDGLSLEFSSCGTAFVLGVPMIYDARMNRFTADLPWA